MITVLSFTSDSAFLWTYLRQDEITAGSSAETWESVLVHAILSSFP